MRHNGTGPKNGGRRTAALRPESTALCIRSRGLPADRPWAVLERKRCVRRSRYDPVTFKSDNMGAPTTLTVLGILILGLSVFVGWFGFPKMIHNKLIEVKRSRVLLLARHGKTKRKYRIFFCVRGTLYLYYHIFKSWIRIRVRCDPYEIRSTHLLENEKRHPPDCIAPPRTARIFPYTSHK